MIFRSPVDEEPGQPENPVGLVNLGSSVGLVPAWVRNRRKWPYKGSPGCGSMDQTIGQGRGSKSKIRAGRSAVMAGR